MRRHLATSRVGHLATATADGCPHVVPCCFVVSEATVYSAVDAKPKSTHRLQRIRNIEANPSVSLLVDHYEDDWARLWWVRLDGVGRILIDGAEREVALDLLAQKYPPYLWQRPPGPVIAIDIDLWRGWP